MRLPLVILGTVAAVLCSSCAECAGAITCHTQPIASTGGQVINHKTGAPVPGVSLRFVRREGIQLVRDTAETTTDSDGFFTLEIGTVYEGEVIGDLEVRPPAPFAPYTATDVRLRASRIRGDGGYLGRLVADPYMILVGEVHRRGAGIVSEGTVSMRRIAGGRLEQDSLSVNVEGGRFAWVDPLVLEYGPVTFEFVITIPGDDRTHRLVQEVPMKFVDGELSFIILEIDP
jgi:hypothetical protein